ncbi:MAG: NTP transferase domain-containing protein [Chitinophagaceae bacterium]|nr:NTP transferase domain-containing protein [Chitinophagaceae bacterium]
MAVTEKNNIITNTYGLVLCGGNSSRMGTDKSMLQYYDKPQRYHVYDMLLPFVKRFLFRATMYRKTKWKPVIHF